MLLPPHNYHRPVTLTECLEQLAQLNADSGTGAARLAKVQVVAGGTDVIFNMRLRLFQPDNLVSIRRIPELQQIEQLENDSVRIGAGCRLIDLGDNPIIRDRYPALKAAIDAVASVHVRNIGTLGGNICLETRCWYTNNSEEWRKGRAGCFKTDCEHCHVIPSSHQCHAINNADTPLALIALDAVLTLQSADGQRDIPIAEFYRPDGIEHMDLRPGELLTHVTIPRCDDRTIFLKFTPRRGMDFALGAVAARCSGSGQLATRVSIIIGSMSAAPLLLDGPCRVLEQEGLDDRGIEMAIACIRDEMGEITNLYARATYKKQIARTLVKRAILALREQS